MKKDFLIFWVLLIFMLLSSCSSNLHCDCYDTELIKISKSPGEVSASDSREARTHQSMATIFFTNDEYEESLSEVLLAIETDPYDYTSYSLASLISEGMGQPTQALEYAYQAILTDTRLHQLNTSYLTANMEDPLKYYLEILECLNDTVIENPKNNSAYMDRAMLYFLLGFYQEAFNDFDQVIKLNVKDSEALYFSAFALLEFDLYEEAIDNLSKAIELNPKESKYLEFRGILYEKIGKYDLALTDYENMKLFCEYHRMCDRANDYISNISTIMK